jgi:hypothetical protein
MFAHQFRFPSTAYWGHLDMGRVPYVGDPVLITEGPYLWSLSLLATFWTLVLTWIQHNQDLKSMTIWPLAPPGATFTLLIFQPIAENISREDASF